MSEAERRRRHAALDFVGMRAQATAAGLVQLCIELHKAKLLDEGALTRIKHAIADEVAEHAPRSMLKQVYLADIRERLDRVFAGDEPVGPLPVLDDSAGGD